MEFHLRGDFDFCLLAQGILVAQLDFLGVGFGWVGVGGWRGVVNFIYGPYWVVETFGLWSQVLMRLVKLGEETNWGFNSKILNLVQIKWSGYWIQLKF